jgi:hypothetical protein
VRLTKSTYVRERTDSNPSCLFMCRALGKPLWCKGRK